MLLACIRGFSDRSSAINVRAIGIARKALASAFLYCPPRYPIHRILAPGGKAKLVDGYHRTALYHDLPVRDADLTSQRFWYHMGYLTVERIRALETALTQLPLSPKLVQLSSLD